MRSRRRIPRSWLKFLVLAVPALAVPAHRVAGETGATYYISPAGNDTNSGTAADQA